MGRTGKMWAIEHEGVEPDILLAGKGIACGMPLGAMIAREDLMTWERGAHGSTYGGNPVACAAALATLEADRATRTAGTTRREVGEFLLERARRASPSATPADQRRPRARADDRDRVPRPRAAERGRAGLLPARAAGARVRRDAIRMSPPLVITEDQVDTALEVFEEAVAEVLGLGLPRGRPDEPLDRRA